MSIRSYAAGIIAAVRGTTPKAARAGLAASKRTNDTSDKWKNADKYPQDISINSEQRTTVISRSRDEFNNNPAYHGHIKSKCKLVVRRGPTIQVSVEDEDPKIGNLIEKRFAEWWTASGYLEKLKIQFYCYLRDGEGIAVMTTNPKLGDVQLDVKPIDCLRGTDGRSQDGGGIIFDKYGNPEFYNILPEHPGLKPSRPVKVPASQVLHMREIQFAEQTRGTPQGASSLITYSGEDRYTSSTIRSAEISACLSGVITTDSANPQEEMDALPPAGATLSTHPGSYQVLPRNTKFETVSPSQPVAEFTAFTSTVISRAAMPFGLPRPLASLDSSNHTFAGSMMDNNTANDLFDDEHEMIERCNIEPVFRNWYAEARFVYPEINTDKKITIVCNWKGGRHIDPVKNANGDRLAMENGTKTYAQACSDSNGSDWRDNLAQIAIEIAEFHKIGLKHPVEVYSSGKSGQTTSFSNTPIQKEEDPQDPQDENEDQNA